ncbi:MBL fold metallo-hydrolase [Diaminobutyricimonas sp. TR449]|uniref:MBL fold metallo-hydrolase n=1 Tax=Diaminobutyricimonas sp. TR449 TaxID=2708076 RepID=UPI00142381F1|nr:MBL fold metallo-hydrolase [Diaminobutyricimonas sp. TR449]
MEPVSTQEFAASGRGTLPQAEAVRDGIRTLPMPLPAVAPPYTLGYLIVDSADDVHVLDPGWDDAANWSRLEQGLATIGKRPADVASITVSHLHSDHLGMAERLRSASGARVALSRREQDAIDALAGRDVADHTGRLDEWGVPASAQAELAQLKRPALAPFRADTLLEDGDDLGIPGRTLTALHTPGHTPGHLSFVDSGDRLLFTGDHLLPNMFPGVGLGGPTESSPIGDYLDALERLAPYDEYEVCPGHGYRFTGLRARREQTAEHHLRRSREVAALLAGSEDLSVWQIASGVHWTAGWPNLHGFELQSALAQTAMHIEFVRSGRVAR